jgi:ATP-dependent DNA helicase Rep
VVLAGVNEGILPFSREDAEITPESIQEERRLMYVGITRARLTLGVSTLKRRKKGREYVQAMPSRFITEMKLGEGGGPKEDPREKLRRLREEIAAKARQAPPTGEA